MVNKSNDVIKPKITFVSKRIVYKNGCKVTQIKENVDGKIQIRLEQI